MVKEAPKHFVCRRCGELPIIQALTADFRVALPGEGSFGKAASPAVLSEIRPPSSILSRASLPLEVRRRLPRAERRGIRGSVGLYCNGARAKVEILVSIARDALVSSRAPRHLKTTTSTTGC